MVLLAAAAWAGGAGWAPATLAGRPPASGSRRPAVTVRSTAGPAGGAGRGCLVAGAAVGGSAMVRAEANAHQPGGARSPSSGRSSLPRCGSPPTRCAGRAGSASYVLLRGTVTEVTGRGRRFATTAPVLVIGGRPVARGRARVGGPGGGAAGPGGRTRAWRRCCRRAVTAPCSGRRPGRSDAASAVRAGIRAAVATGRARGPRRSCPRSSSATTGRCRPAWWRTSGPAG